MTALFIYLIQVNIALALFCAGYYLVLRPLTFYTLNRAYLVFALLFATAYPLINLSGFISTHRQIARPVQMVAVNWQAQVTIAIHCVVPQPKDYNWPEIIFWAGVLLFAFRFLVQLLSLYRLHQKSTPVLLHQHLVRSVNKNINPFSFLKSIYVNPKNHQPEELNAILEHEQVHVDEWHTFDILLGELSIIFYWFNPGVWLMKSAIHENIEFITDRRILQNGLDAKAYQYSLLSVNFNNSNHTLINHFNASAIKKRIIMMNTERSSPLNITRYLFLLPIVGLLLLAFTVSKTGLDNPILKGRDAVVSVYKNINAQIEDKTQTAASYNDKRTAPELLRAVNIVASAEQPAFTHTLPTRIPAIAGSVADTVRDILPGYGPRNMPDSMYVDGKYGNSKELLRNFNDGDITEMGVYYASAFKLKENLLYVFTRNFKDLPLLLDFIKDMNRRRQPRENIDPVFLVDGKPTSLADVEKMPTDNIKKITMLRAGDWIPVRDAGFKTGGGIYRIYTK